MKKIIYVEANYIDEEIFNHTGGSLSRTASKKLYRKWIKKAQDNDLIILSDSDEIPDLKKLNEIKPKTKFTAFSQKMFMYKLNLQNLNESNWIGSKFV